MTVRANVVAMISLGEIERMARKKKRLAKKRAGKKALKAKTENRAIPKKKNIAQRGRKQKPTKNSSKIDF